MWRAWNARSLTLILHVLGWAWGLESEEPSLSASAAPGHRSLQARAARGDGLDVTVVGGAGASSC